MVFVISLMLIENLEDKIRSYTPIRMHNMTTWAQIPGRMEYDYKKKVTLYGIDSIDLKTDLDTVHMSSYGPYEFKVNREFLNPIFDDHHGVINYTMSHIYTLTSPDIFNYTSQNITHINFDGLSIWY